MPPERFQAELHRFCCRNTDNEMSLDVDRRKFAGHQRFVGHIWHFVPAEHIQLLVGPGCTTCSAYQDLSLWLLLAGEALVKIGCDLKAFVALPWSLSWKTL